MAATLYASGIAIYVLARRQRRERLFSPIEAVLAAALVIAGLAAAWLIHTGTITPLS